MGPGQGPARLEILDDEHETEVAWVQLWFIALHFRDTRMAFSGDWNTY
jgi:hypothetical protein